MAIQKEKLQPVRGTQDLYGDQIKAFRFIDAAALSCAKLFGYEEVQTPIFEFSEVFHRTLGETSDIVSKETYTFQDRGGDSLTLRPEGTAGVARAFISNGWTQNLPLKLYYSGPMFRYERPQKGRYRQFHQLGVEHLGSELPLADVESLSLAWNFLKKVGLSGKVSLELNTLGDIESRKKHRDLLVEYFKSHEKNLSADSQERLKKNPLRILDSKDEGDKKIVANAPSIQSCLNEKSMQFFNDVQNGLKSLGIKYNINSNLVRGIDYYSHTVFEFVTTELGAQGTVLAGGRYDGLIEHMGGPKTPGVGWACGLERLSMLVAQELIAKEKSPVAIIPFEDQFVPDCLKMADEIRAKEIPAEVIVSGNIGKRFKRADKIGACYAVVLGADEKAKSVVALKDLKSGEQKLVPWTEAQKIICAKS